MRPGTGWRPGYKIEPYPTISRENFIYFILDVPGNRRKPGASQKNVGFTKSYVFLTCSGFPTVSRDVSYKVQGRVATKGHLSHADYCNFVDFNFSAWFFAQIVENRETQLSSIFLSPGDIFSKSYDENRFVWQLYGTWDFEICARRPSRGPRTGAPTKSGFRHNFSKKCPQDLKMG